MEELFDIIEKDGEEYIVIATTEPGHKLELMLLDDFIIRNRIIEVGGKRLTLYDFIENEKEKIRVASLTRKPRIAIVPGSFDPITNGHLDIIKKAADIYDKVYVAVMINDQKNYMFKLSQREEIAREAVKHIENVQVISSIGMLWELAKTLKACAIVKGVRNQIDLEYERKMAAFNSEHYPEAQTIFMTADKSLSEVSSTVVREMIKANQDISDIVPSTTVELIKKYI